MKDEEKSRAQLTEELVILREQVSALVGIQRESKRVEAAYRESEARWRILLDHAYDGITISKRNRDDLMGRRNLVYCNDRFVEMSGYSREILMACENLFDLTVSHLLPEEHESNLRQMKAVKPYRGISSWNRPDGRENYHEWVSVPVEIEGELFSIGIDRDITQRRQMEAELREAERLRVVTETAGGAAHEINQHLQVIVGQAQLLLKQMASDSPYVSGVGKIETVGMEIADILLKMQDVKQYATKPYVGNRDIVDFDQASQEGGATV